MTKQLLVRVPEDLHGRLLERAAREGRSLNALANEVLAAHLADDAVPTCHRLRSRARAQGVLASARPAPPVNEDQRAAALAAARGGGPILDELLADGR